MLQMFTSTYHKKQNSSFLRLPVWTIDKPDHASFLSIWWLVIHFWGDFLFRPQSALWLQLAAEQILAFLLLSKLEALHHSCKALGVCSISCFLYFNWILLRLNKIYENWLIAYLLLQFITFLNNFFCQLELVDVPNRCFFTFMSTKQLVFCHWDIM